MPELDFTNVLNIGLLGGTIIFSTINIIFSTVNIHSTNRTHSISLFFEYTKRFSEIRDRLPSDIFSQAFDTSRLESGGLLAVMADYFDLCSEEFYLRHKFGWISRDIWKEWHMRISDILTKPAFREAWRKLRSETVWYSGFQTFVDRLAGVDDSDNPSSH